VVLRICLVSFLLAACGKSNDGGSTSALEKQKAALIGTWESSCVNEGDGFYIKRYLTAEKESIEQSFAVYSDTDCEDPVFTRRVVHTYEIAETDAQDIFEFNVTLQEAYETPDVDDSAAYNNEVIAFEYADWETGVEKDILDRGYDVEDTSIVYTTDETTYTILSLTDENILLLGQLSDEENGQKKSTRPTELNTDYEYTKEDE
jgi:hypothetical protein